VEAIMTKFAVAALAVAGLVLTAARGEEETVAVKVYVKGMSCPNGCAPRVAKGLESVEGAKDVKLADFDKGLFTVSFDPKAAVKPSVLQKAIGSYEVTKVEATLTGTVAKVDKELVLTTPSGAKYSVVNVGADACELTKKTEEPKKADPAKKEEACECCSATNVVAKIEGFLKDNKTTIKVTGVVSECCQGSLTIAAATAVPVEAKKATN
jgi:hypothetical protein